MNTIKNMMDKGQKMFETLNIEFVMEEIKSFKVTPSDVTLDLETIKSLVKDLKEQKMVTLVDNVTHMGLFVSIDRSRYFTKELSYFIETFHTNLEDLNSDYGFDMNLNVPKSLHEFIGVDMNLNVPSLTPSTLWTERLSKSLHEFIGVDDPITTL